MESLKKGIPCTSNSKTEFKRQSEKKNKKKNDEGMELCFVSILREAEALFIVSMRVL